MYEQIQYERRDGVGLLTLNRPQKMNAWTSRMSAELIDAIQSANADPDVGALVMTGAGRGFCAGADIGDTFQQAGEDSRPAAPANGVAGMRGMPEGTDWIELVRSAKPLVAAVNGPAVGIGVTMIAPFDVIIASERARFGMFFVRMGLTPELASSHFLVQRMGFGRASEMCLTGRLYDAQEACRMGLVDRVAEHDTYLDEALELAGEMASNPSRQLRMIKDLLTRNGCATDLKEIQRLELEALREAAKSPEHLEAVRAFTEKRAPRFTRR